MIDNVGKYIIHNAQIQEATSFLGLNCEIKNCKVIYEVIRVIDGVPLFVQDHYDRLKSSFESLSFSLKIGLDDFSRGIFDLIRVNNVSNCNIMLRIIADENQEWDLYIRESHYPSRLIYQQGIRVGTIDLERNHPEAKVWNSEYKAKVDQKIKDEDLFEVLLVNHAGYITEGSRSNIFFIKGNKVYTSPLKYVLRGITSIYAIKCCERVGVEVVNELIPEENLSEIDAAFITGTSVNILPIASINNIHLESSKNKIVILLMNAFETIIMEEIKNH